MKAVPKPKSARAKFWFIYMLKCSNGSLYTGITTDVKERLKVHNAGKGSAYVRSHLPASLVASLFAGTRSEASVLEYHVKSLTRVEKLALAKTWRSKKLKLKAETREGNGSRKAHRGAKEEG